MSAVKPFHGPALGLAWVHRPLRGACQILFGLSLLTVMACGEPTGRKAEEQQGPAPSEKAPSEKTEALALAQVAYADLPGWGDEDFHDALSAFAASCQKLLPQPADRAVGTPAVDVRAGDFEAACRGLPTIPDAAVGGGADAGAIRHYFEDHFTPYLARDAGEESVEEGVQGLFTGYFEAELRGARQPSDRFATPLYRVPQDLVIADLGRFNSEMKGTRLVGRVEDGKFVPYPERGAIEAGLLAAQSLELLWIDDPVDVFLLQVQGSGRVILPDGDVVRVGFAGHNGQPYRSIGRVLIDRGEIAAHAASWDGIRNWIEENPDKAGALFAENPRFIFFRLIEGQSVAGAPDGPIGAQGVALTPRRSIAVDRAYIPLGLPIWLDTTRPGTTEAPLRRLMIAQDTGGAIKGPVRGDFFWGYGDKALAEAGRMKSRGQYFLLLPNPASERRKTADS